MHKMLAIMTAARMAVGNAFLSMIPSKLSIARPSRGSSLQAAQSG
jgi:hypothetical protein